MCKFNYKTIMDLGFKEQIEDDPVYFDEYGYKYAIIYYKLNKYLELDWKKDTQECTLLRVKKGSVLKRRKIQSLEELKEIINFFKDK